MRTMTPRCAMGLVMGLLAGPLCAQETPVLQKQEEKVSYSFGVQMGKSLKQAGIEIDPDILVKGLKDSLAGGKLLMTDEDMQTTMNDYQSALVQKQAQAKAKASEGNQQEGAAFLADNKTKEGVVTLPSGLQYKILKPGDGQKPAAADTVECHYRGTLIDGTEFDSSYRRGQPATFPVSGVIPGWTEALKLMPVGSKWKLFIPSQLAYGERGAGRDIGPGATLVFEVELLGIK